MPEARFQCLRQDNVDHGLCIVKAQASACLKLSVINRHDTASYDLCHVRTGVDTECHDCNDDFIDIHACKYDKVNDKELYQYRR